MAILLITHDLGVVARMAHRVGVMYAGELVEVASRDAFFARPQHPYTQALFAALPDIARRGAALATIPGQVPALAEMPPGCRFANRCQHAMALCREVSPPWRDAVGAHALRCHWTGTAAAPDGNRHGTGAGRATAGVGCLPRRRRPQGSFPDPPRPAAADSRACARGRRRFPGHFRRPHAGAGRRIGLRQDHGRQGAAATGASQPPAASASVVANW